MIVLDTPLGRKISIICVSCGGDDFKRVPGILCCMGCGAEYSIRAGKIHTAKNYFESQSWEEVSQGFDPTKDVRKPVKVDRLGGPRIRELIQKLKIEGLAVNLGSGMDDYPGFLNLDLGNYKPVHIVADFKQIPLKSESVQLVACNSVLEHIYDFQKVYREIERIIVKGGYLYLSVPFMSLRHHKYDYHRWTSAGLSNLVVESFEIIESGTCRGADYALLSYLEALRKVKSMSITRHSQLKLVIRMLRNLLPKIQEYHSEESQAFANTIYVLARKRH